MVVFSDSLGGVPPNYHWTLLVRLDDHLHAQTLPQNDIWWPLNHHVCICLLHKSHSCVYIQIISQPIFWCIICIYIYITRNTSQHLHPSEMPKFLCWIASFEGLVTSWAPFRSQLRQVWVWAVWWMLRFLDTTRAAARIWDGSGTSSLTEIQKWWDSENGVYFMSFRLFQNHKIYQYI